jgi:hypothetical protein
MSEISWTHYLQSYDGNRVLGEIDQKMRSDFDRFRAQPSPGGAPEKVVMCISGHKTREVFNRYNIVSETRSEKRGAEVGQLCGERVWAKWAILRLVRCGRE